jgi:magnesium transporter
MGKVRSRVYVKGELDCEDITLEAISDHLARPDTIVWVDFCHPSPADLEGLADELHIHQLAVEDALSPHQRTKIDRYESHLFLTTYAAGLDRQSSRLVKTEIDAFVGDRWLITVRSSDAFSMQPVLERWDRAADQVAVGVGYLVYALLDEVVDGYFDTVSAFDEYYDDVSDGIFTDRPVDPSQQREWFEMRRTLARFHRLVAPLREALSSLMHREEQLVKPALFPYFQDLYDHVVVVSESTESARDQASSLVEANLSLRDYRQNQVMKKVTSWAAIVAVPTLITGYYGMNVPFPTFGRHIGVWVASTLMVTCSLALYWQFKRRDWL